MILLTIIISIILFIVFISYKSSQPRDIRIIRAKSGKYRIQVRNNLFPAIWTDASRDSDDNGDQILYYGEGPIKDDTLEACRFRVQKYLDRVDLQKKNAEIDEVVQSYPVHQKAKIEKFDLSSLADNEEERELLTRIQNRM